MKKLDWDEDQDEDDDHIRFARGLRNGLVMGMVLWVIIIIGVVEISGWIWHRDSGEAPAITAVDP